MGYLKRVLDRLQPANENGLDADEAASGPTNGGPMVYSKPDYFIDLLETQGGRMRQSDLVASSDWSESTVSRVLSEMEADQTIRKIRVGRQNVITLIGSEPQWYSPPESLDGQQPSAAASNNGTTARPILLVEDNPRDTELIRRGFEEADVAVQVHTVRDGVDALEFLTNEGSYTDAPCPEIVLLDLSLLLIDGIELLDAVEERDELRGMPIIVLSNSRNPSDIEDAYRHGATAYLTKPDDFESMTDLCRSVGEFWLKHAHRPGT